jgi:hypothetical protein
LFAALLLAMAASSAQGVTKKPVKHLWATLNVCDTKHSPDRLGVRGRMPGDGTKERMYMRFTAQFRQGKVWKAARGARSTFLFAGSARYLYKEFGFTFDFGPLKKGQRFRMRGLVEFQWRARRGKGSKARWVVVRHTQRFTEGGHRTKNAEPAGYSAATCLVSRPAS